MMMSTDSPRPVLLPQNRKVRHLRGISLRNLSFVRPRGRTIDDAAVSTKSPGKLDTLHEAETAAAAHQLHHALSTESLRPLLTAATRRRSTNLGSASPLARQKRLEYTVESRVADVFVSLHVQGEEEPVYISEVAERKTNFNFGLFELDDLDPSITRSSHITVKVWSRRQENWSLLIEDDVDLRSLNWLGSLQDTHFPPNCIIFHLVDGIYSLELAKKYPPPKEATPLPTASYNALMKLATLDNTIQDALATRDGLAQQINEILGNTPANRYPEAEGALALANKLLGQEKRAVATSKRKCEDLKASIAARRAKIEKGRSMQIKAAEDVEHATEKLALSKELVAKTGDSIRGQRRRICEDLTQIYKIEHVSLAAPLAFQICGVPLPNTTYDSTLSSSKAATEDVLSAALGHVALLTDSLQFYLGVPLPYPVRAFGSRSSIRDDISQLGDPQREFPLHMPRGGSAAQYRFDYAWFLLNKDIETLCVAQGLRVVDIRHTLPNLKYLLYVCSAGRDELPARKRGGVRGLWAGHLRSSLAGGVGGPSDSAGTGSRASSRRGSAESDALAKPQDELRSALRAGKSFAGEAEETGSAHPVDSGPLALPFGEGGAKITLRTKGLRENVVR